MNRRTSILYIATVAVAVICLILDLIFQDIAFSFLGICFSLTMMVYGLCLIVRGFRFKIDSSLFLGIIILCFGILSTIADFTEYGYLDLLHYLLIGASIASLITGIYFKSKSQQKLTILFIGFFVIVFLFKIHLYKWWIMLLACIVWLFGYLVVNNILQNRSK
ncbi:MAG: hypothetical protein IJA72_03935 [Clostridia bacterium]|nr:hypothetical protein [Clostridia bacterium]